MHPPRESGRGRSGRGRSGRGRSGRGGEEGIEEKVVKNVSKDTL